MKKTNAPGMPTSEDPVLIRKYGNRRLYSSRDGRFVTLDEIAQWVKKGQHIRVTDANSDVDITAEILTQILLEGGRAQHFPVELLEQMIRLNEETLKGFWETYFSQSFKMFLGVQKEMEQFYQRVSQRTMQLGSLNPLFSFWNREAQGKEPVPPARYSQKEPSQDSVTEPPPHSSSIANRPKKPRRSSRKTSEKG